jgi:hypothetical protein
MMIRVCRYRCPNRLSLGFLAEINYPLPNIVDGIQTVRLRTFLYIISISLENMAPLQNKRLILFYLSPVQ